MNDIKLVKEPQKNTHLNTYLPKAVGLSQAAVNIVLILASLIAVYEYFAVREENRIEQTMKQVTIFSSSELLKARLKLAEWSESTNRLIEKINKETVKDEKETENITKKIKEQSINEVQLNESAILILNFFSNLEICVKNHICDASITKEYFCKYAYNFNSQYQFLLKVNTNTEHALEGLGKFVSSHCQLKLRPENNF